LDGDVGEWMEEGEGGGFCGVWRLGCGHGWEFGCGKRQSWAIDFSFWKKGKIKQGPGFSLDKWTETPNIRLGLLHLFATTSVRPCAKLRETLVL
jgi:hypothetical protein